MKKKIGISYTQSSFENYWNWFTPRDLEDDIELVELSYEKNNTDDIYTCDGFILTGGVDVEPSLYGGTKNYKHKPETFSPERDAFEKLIYNYSQEQQLPVLGICRGMQYINILEGGNLFEDIGDVANQVHRKDPDDKVHGVSIEKDTLLHSITGKDFGFVNSAHHQGANPQKLGDNLMASAHSDTADAMIEGLEFRDKTNKGFMLAVQWHPERMEDKETEPLSQKIKKQFIHEVRTQKK